MTVRCPAPRPCRGHLLVRRTTGVHALAGRSVRVLPGDRQVLLLRLTGLPRSVLLRGARLRTSIGVQSAGRGRGLLVSRHGLVIIGRVARPSDDRPARDPVRPMLPPSFVPPGNRARLAMILLTATIAVDVVAIESDFLEILGRQQVPGRQGSHDRRARQRATIVRRSSASSNSPFSPSRRSCSSDGSMRCTGTAHHSEPRSCASSPDGRSAPGSFLSWASGALKQIANDIWRASEPHPPARGAQAPRTGKTGLLTLWWSFWVLSILIDHSATRIFNANTLADFSRGAKLDIAALVLDITAAVLAILVVHRITKWQAELGPICGAGRAQPGGVVPSPCMSA